MEENLKQLLLKDICARLLYSVKCNACLKQIDGSLKSIFGTFKGYNNGWATVGNNIVDIETVKPYLRPISSITEEEERELNGLLSEVYDFTFRMDELLEFIQMQKEIPFHYIDWLNEHHFDYRGLIPMGLALPAPEGMYN